MSSPSTSTPNSRVKRGSIVAVATEQLTSPQETPTKSSIDEGEIQDLRKKSIVTRRSSSLNTGEIAKLVQSTTEEEAKGLSTPPPQEVAVITQSKGKREKAAQKEKAEKAKEIREGRKSRASDALDEVQRGSVDIKKEVERRSSAAFSPDTTEEVFKKERRQREVSAFAHALKRDSLIEDNLHGSEYTTRKNELIEAHLAYEQTMKTRATIGECNTDMQSLDGAIKAKSKRSVGEKISESKPRSKTEVDANDDTAQPDWQKKGWTNETKLAGKRGFLLKKGGSKRNENGRSVKLFTRHNWNTRFFLLNTSTKTLSYFRNEVDPTPLGILDLSECSINRIGHHIHTFVLELNGPGRKGFLLAAANIKELDDWEGALSSFCKQEVKPQC